MWLQQPLDGFKYIFETPVLSSLLFLSSVCAWLPCLWHYASVGYIAILVTKCVRRCFVAPVSPLLWVSCECVASWVACVCFVILSTIFYNNDNDRYKGGRQEESAIVIFRLLLRLRRMYVTSLCLDLNGMRRTQFETRVWTLYHS